MGFLNRGCILVLTSALWTVGCTDKVPTRAPHAGIDVVIVLIDTLRPDHLGFYGYERETAPFLAELASESAVFTRAYSTSSWTAPATASLLTGLYPQNHGVLAGFFVKKNKPKLNSIPRETELAMSRLPESINGIAGLLRDAGYRTYAIATNAHISPELGFDTGFDRYDYLKGHSVQDVEQALAAWAPEMLASPAPTFLYLHLNDVHGPYVRHAPWYEKDRDPLRDEISAYDSGISHLDGELRKIATQLDWTDDTLLVVTSDHGEEFREHGQLHHRGGLHQELTRILLMIGGPGIEAHRVSADVSLVDVLPTLLELLEIDAVTDRDGRSLVPILRADDGDVPASLSDRTLFAHRLEKARRFGKETWAAIQGRWKMIEGIKGQQLFDLENDFFEQHDRAGDEPEIRDALLAKLAEYRDHNRGLDENTEVNVSIDPATRRHLEELGYVEEESSSAAEPPASK